ncbi:MAG: 23S rRNA (guanosine2251-2'-O)-methyltransferase [Flavobacteriales bacterium]|jgi:23S rRNA (guanosine2251-2'-O)-methyltransferase
MKDSDSDAYLAKKALFDQMLTIFGRKPVHEALLDSNLSLIRLHLADSNRPAPIIKDLIKLAEKHGTEICYHSRAELSRISKNAKQDQGVALDIKPKQFGNADSLLANGELSGELIALDNITNPQNLGMIIRSVSAAGIRGLILPKKGCAKLDSLVIKASAGTLFKAPILRCDNLEDCLREAKKQGFAITGLDLKAKNTLGSLPASNKRIYVLGNETEGISNTTRKLCTESVIIPMHNGVESLNVAVTASLIAFKGCL